MVGYVHHGITDWSAGAELRLRVSFLSQDKSVHEQTFTLKKDEHEARNIEMIFEQPLDLLPGLQYDLVQTNIGVNFHARHGSTPKEEVGPFKFFKSPKDNNGTSNTSGQFKGIILQAHI
jgi:hypothetical protein